MISANRGDDDIATKEKLGNLLLRAELITESQLTTALDTQRRTLRRLGDIIVEMRMVSQKNMRDVVALQTTETVYKLFHWKAGTYEFEPGAPLTLELENPGQDVVRVVPAREFRPALGARTSPTLARPRRSLRAL